MKELNVVGKRLRKLDNPAKANGEVVNTTDPKFPRQHYRQMLRSPLSHTMVLNLDVSKVSNLAGLKQSLCSKKRCG